MLLHEGGSWYVRQGVAFASGPKIPGSCRPPGSSGGRAFGKGKRYAPTPLRSSPTYPALLRVERELDTSELYSCAFVEWNRVVRRHAAAVDTCVVRAIQVHDAPLTILLPQQSVAPANPTRFATMRRHIDVGVNAADRIFTTDH